MSRRRCFGFKRLRVGELSRRSLHKSEGFGVNIQHKILMAALAVLAVLMSANQASACSCIAKRPPCEAFGTARAVFVGKVIGSKERREIKNDDGTKVTFDVGEIYFKLEEAFAGVKGPRVVIHSGTGGGDCGYWFQRGQRYLVYANGESVKSLSTNICSRTKPLAEADEDLVFLRNLPRAGVGARIYGTVATIIKSADAEGTDTMQPLVGITVKMKGAHRTFDATTDSEGRYELTGLEPGEYQVQAIVQDHYYKSENWMREVLVNDRGCAREDFLALNDSTIRGRVIDPQGQGLSRARVVLIPVDTPDKTIWTLLESDYADEQGEFELELVAPGRYLLGINIGASPDADTPYPRTFYPGVTERSQATVIEVGLGQRITDVNIQLPPKLMEYKVSGVVVWPNGVPVAQADIHLEDVDYPGWCIDNCAMKTDAQGRFTLRGYAGFNYQVKAGYEKRVEGSPQKMVAEPPAFKLTSDVVNLRLILSSPEKKSDEKENKSP